MPLLRQSTSQVILFGPCLDKTDGVTEETALTLAQADMRLSKDGAAFAQKNATGNATHDSDGWYNTTLNATDTATVGELILNVHQPANMLPVWKTWWVIEEAVYDAIYGAAAAGPLQSTVAGRKLDVAATGEAGVDHTNIIGTLDAGDFGAGFITAAKLAAGAIDNTAIGADAITASKVAPDVHAEAADAVWDEAKAGHVGATTFGDLATDVDSVLADTADIQPKIGTPDVDQAADVAAIKVVVDANQTRLPTALVAGRINSTPAIASGSATSAGTTTTLIDTTRTEANNFWNHTRIRFTSGAEINKIRLIQDFTAGDDTLHFNPPAGAAIASGVTYEIWPQG